MKKFFRFGKKKKGANADSASLASGSRAASRSGSIASETGVYVVRDKDLPKLHKAAWTGDLGKVKQLAKKNVNELDKSNRSALHFACSKGNAAIVRELLEWKAKPNVGDNQQRTPLIKAVQSGSRDCIQLLLEERAEVNTTDLDGNSALHHAVESCDVEVINILLDCGRINIDIQNKEGQSPLHYAVQLKRLDVTRALIQGGADVNIQDYEGKTPLMVCCTDGSADLARLLLQNGADTKIKNSAGWTADDIAVMSNHDNCREVIGQFTSRGGGRQQRATGGHHTSAAAGRGMYGLPAPDEGDMSDVDNTVSRASDAGADSWADSEEDSDMGAVHGKKRSGSPHRSKPPAYDDIVEEADLPRPPVGFGGSRIDLAESDASGSDSENDAENVPKLNLTAMMSEKKTNEEAKIDQGASKLPLTSARSNASAHSALSFGGDDPSTWSDNDDSLFSSARGAPKKVNLAKFAGRAKSTSVQEEDDKTGNDDWSDEDVSLPLSGAESRPKTTVSKKPVQKQSVIESDDGEEDENKRKEEAEQRKSIHGIAKDKAKQLMEELGISDVSDVSDPLLSEDDSPLAKFKQAVSKKAANKQAQSDEESDWDSSRADEPERKVSFGKPPPAPVTSKPEESDWDTTEAPTPRSAAGTNKVPLSARSAVSDWDSTIDEEDEAAKPVAKGPHIPQAQDRDEESAWDSTVEDESPRKVENKVSNEKVVSRKKDESQTDSKWDSDDSEDRMDIPTIPSEPADQIKMINNSIEEVEELEHIEDVKESQSSPPAPSGASKNKSVTKEKTLKFEGEIDEQIEDLLTPPVEFNGSAYARNSQNIGAEVGEIPPPLPKSSPPPLPTKPPPIGRKESSSSGWDDSDVEQTENKQGQPSPKPTLNGAAPVVVGKPEVNKEDSDAWDSDEEVDSEAENNKKESTIRLINENKPIKESKLKEETKEDDNNSRWDSDEEDPDEADKTVPKENETKPTDVVEGDQGECPGDEEDDPASVVDSSFKFLHPTDRDEEDHNTDFDESELEKDADDATTKEMDVENGDDITHQVGKGSSSSSSSKKSSSSGSSAKTQIKVGRKEDTGDADGETKDTTEEPVKEIYDYRKENLLNQVATRRKSSSSSSGTSTPRNKSSTKEYIPPSLRNIFTPLSSDKEITDRDSMEEEFEAVSKPDRSISHKASLDAKKEKGLNEISSIEAEGSVSGRSTPCSGLRRESRRRKSTSSSSSSSTRCATPKRRASHEKPPIPPAEGQIGKSSRSSKPDSRRASSSSESGLSSGTSSRKKDQDHRGSSSKNRRPTGSRPSSAGSAAGLEKIRTALQKVLDSTTPVGRESSTPREKSKSGSRRSSIGNEDGQVSSKKKTTDVSRSSFALENRVNAKIVTYAQQSTVETKDEFIEEEPSTDEGRNELNLADELQQSGHFTNHSVNSTPRPLVGSTPREMTVELESNQQPKLTQKVEEDDDWDSDTSLPLSPTEKVAPASVASTRLSQSPSHPVAPVPVKKPAPMYGGVETDSEEEESESEWEKENKVKKEAEVTRHKKWEEEFERQQEKLRQEAAEELKKEQEDQERKRRQEEEEERQERDRKQAEEEERLERERREAEEKERQERLENERIETERREREQRERREREEKERKEKEEKERIEREQREKREREEQERRRKEEEEEKLRKARSKAAEKRSSWQTKIGSEGNITQIAKLKDDVNALGDFSDDDADLVGHEAQLHEEVPQKKVPPPVAPKPVLKQKSASADDFDDDSFDDDIDIADIHNIKMPGVGRVNGHQQDDDCLSYSSTEHDVSIHDTQLNGSTAPVNVTAPRNMSFNNEVIGSPRHQEQLRDLRRQLDRERSMRISLENRRKNIEKEKSDLLQKLEDVTRAKSGLEQIKIDSDAKLRTLQYNLNEETEKRKNSEMLYNKTKEQLSRKDEQYTQEVEAKQNTELAMRNMQMELRTALANIKQLEEEKEDLNRQLSHEKSARLLQEQINEEQVQVQAALHGKEDVSLLGSQKLQQDLAEAYSKLESADESRKQAVDSVEKLRAELYATKMEFERQKNRFKDDHGLLSSENEDLQTKIEELKSDIKLNEEALAHATMQYNIQLSQLKTENTVLISNLEKERNSKEKTESEIKSLQIRLDTTIVELEKAQAARSELERNNHKTNEDWTRSLERKDKEINALKEANQNHAHKSGAAESRMNTLENELHIANATLAERTNQLQTIQREIEQRRMNQDNLDESFRKKKEDNVRMEARMESLQDRLSNLQHENLRLQQLLDEAKLSGGKSDSGDKLSATLLAQIKQDQDKARSSLEERNASLNENLVRVREELRSMEGRKTSLEQELRHAQKELTDLSKRCSIAEASLEVSNKAKEQLEAERARLLADVERLQTKLEAAQEKYIESNVKVSQLADRVERADYSTQLTSQQLHNQSGNVEALARSKTELEEAVHRLELEKAKLEAALDHEQEKTHMLQRDLGESQKIRDTLENMVSNLKSTNEHMEGKITAQQELNDKVNALSSQNTGLKYEANEALAAKTVAAHEAEDSRGLWESEVKARSKLGLRIAQLERQRQEAEAKVEEEKKRVRKALGLKKISEANLQAEADRNGHLQKEIATLKSHLKSTKRRLKDLNSSELTINAITRDFEHERSDLNSAMRLLRNQLDDVNGQLEMEMDNKNQMERETRTLQMELNSLRAMDKTYAKLERAKRKVEEEFSAYKEHVNANYVERTAIDRLQGDLETRTRMELNQKLEEVNTYLEEQSKAREKIDQMRDDNDNMMRKEFEKTKKELSDELNKMKSINKETKDEKESMDFELQKYKDLYEAEQKLREKLAKRLEKASDKAAKAQLYMDRQRLSGSLPIQAAWSPQGTSTPFAKPVVGHGVNDLSFSMKAELERSIAKHLEKTPHIDISLPPRSLTEDSSLRPSFERSSSEYLSVLKKNYML